MTVRLIRGESGSVIGFRISILGQPASKANSRKLAIVTTKEGEKRPLFIKSEAARNYERAAWLQVPVQKHRFLEGKLRATIRIWYATNLPDLDESLILDVLQERIYANDRQVREKHVYHAIDKANPRAEIEIDLLEIIPVTGDLPLPEPIVAETPVETWEDSFR